MYIKEGDRNTLFFFLGCRLANSHRRNNFIVSLQVGDSISVDQEEIRNSFEHYFSDLFKETQSWHPKLDRIQFDMLEDEEAIELENLFTEEKVFQALYSVDSDKAPGLDDFTIDFFQKCWNVVKGDIVWLFHNFHHREMFERSLNPAFISLIPKKKVGAVELRRISGLLASLEVYTKYWLKFLQIG